MARGALGAVREMAAGAVGALVLAGFVLLPAGPSTAAAVLLVAPASVTTVHAPDEALVIPPEPVWGDESATDPAATGETTRARRIVGVDDAGLDPFTVDEFAGSSGRSSLTGQSQLRLAYLRAAAAMPQTCHLNAALLAALGQVESGNLGGRVVGADHVVRPPVLGPPLTGGAYANIPDTDGGRLDGSSAYDRAVGPMQFIPGTWATSGRDGDGDGVADPQNVYDAALSAAGYLCASGRDLARAEDLTAALWSYNASAEYAAVVRGWFAYFLAHGLSSLGSTSAGDIPTTPSTPTPSATPTATATPTPTVTPTSTASPSPSVTSSPGDTPSGGPSPSASPSSPSSSPSSCPSQSPTPSGSGSPSASPSGVTPTPTSTASPTAPSSPPSSPSPTPTVSATSPSAPGQSPSVSNTPGGCGSPSAAPSNAPGAAPTSAPAPSPSLTAAIGTTTTGTTTTGTTTSASAPAAASGTVTSSPAPTITSQLGSVPVASGSPSPSRSPEPQQTATP